jgi:hypothetical protein
MPRRKKEGPSLEARQRGMAASEASRNKRKIDAALSNVRSDTYKAGLSYLGGKGGKKAPFTESDVAAGIPDYYKTVAKTAKFNLEAGIKEGNPLKYAPNLEGLRNDALRARDAGDVESAQKLADVSKFYEGYKSVWGNQKQGAARPRKGGGKQQPKGGDGYTEPEEKNPFKRALGTVLGAPGVQQALKTLRTPFSYVASHTSDIAQQLEEGDIVEAVGALGRAVPIVGGITGETVDALEGKGFDIGAVLNSYENEKNRKDFWKQTGVGEYLQRGLDKHTWDDDTILNDKWVKRGIGFAGDVGLDPLTYLTAGSTKMAGSAANVATRITESGAQLAAKEGAEAFAKAAATGLDQEFALAAKEAAEEAAKQFVKKKAADVISKGKRTLTTDDMRRLFPDEKVAGGLAWRVPFTGRPTRAVMRGLTRGKFVPEEKLIPLLRKDLTNPMQRVLSKPARALGASRLADKAVGKFAGELGQEIRGLIRSGDPDEVYKGLGIKRATNVMRSRAASSVRVAEDDLRAIFGDDVANKLIVNAGEESVGPDLAKLWTRYVAPAIKGREDEVLRAVETGATAGDEGAEAVVKFYEAAYRSLERSGAKMGKVGERQYIPWQFTEEGRKAWEQTFGEIPEGTTAIDPRVAFEKARTTLSGERTFESMDEARQYIETKYGQGLKGGKVFETDINRIAANYIRQADQRLGRQALLRELEGWGITKKVDEDYLERVIKMAETKSPKVAANNVVNKVGKSLPLSQKRKAQQAVQRVLEDEVAARADEVAAEAGEGLGGRLRTPAEATTPEEQAMVEALQEGVTGEPIPASEVVDPRALPARAAMGDNLMDVTGDMVPEGWFDPLSVGVEMPRRRLPAGLRAGEEGLTGPPPNVGEYPTDPFVPYSDAGPEYQIQPNPTYMDPEGVTGGTWIKNYDTSVDPEDFAFVSQQEAEKYATSAWGEDIISLVGGAENLDGVEIALLRRGAATPQMQEMIRNIIKNRRQMPLMTKTTLNSSIDSYYKLGNPTDEMISAASGVDRSDLLEQRLLHIAKGMFDDEANMIADGINFNSVKEAIEADPFADELKDAIRAYAARERYALARENYLNAQATSRDAVEARGEAIAADSWDTLEADADAYAKAVRDKFLESTENVNRAEQEILDIQRQLGEGRLSEEKFVELIRRKEALENEIWDENQITWLESSANEAPLPHEELVRFLRAKEPFSALSGMRFTQRFKDPAMQEIYAKWAEGWKGVLPDHVSSLPSLEEARLMDALEGMRRQLAEHNSLNTEMADEAIKRIETMRSLGYTMVEATQVGGPRSWNVPTAKRIEAMNLVDATADDIMRIRGVGTQAFNTYVSIRSTLDAEIDSLFNAFQQKVYTSELPQPPRVGMAAVDPEEIAARIEWKRLHGPADWDTGNITDSLPIAWEATPAATQHANIQNVINESRFSEYAERLVNLQRQNLRLQNAVLSGDPVKFRKAIVLHFLEGSGGRPLELPDELFDQYIAAVVSGDPKGIDAFVMKMPFPEHPMRSGSLTGRVQGPPAPIGKARPIDPNSAVADFSGDAEESIKSYYTEAVTKYELERQKLQRSYELFVDWAKLHRSDANGKIVYRTEDLATLRELKKRFEALVKPDPSANSTRLRSPLEEYAEIPVNPSKGRQIKITDNGTILSRDNIFRRVSTIERDAELTRNYKSLVESRVHLDELQQTARQQHAAAKAAGNKEAMREARVALNNIKEARLRLDRRLSELGLTDSKGIAANGRKVGELKAINDLGLVEREGAGVLATVDDLPRLNEFIAKVQQQLDQTSRFGEKGYWKIVDKNGNKRFANLSAYQFEIGRLQGAIEKVEKVVEKVNTLERLAQARRIATTNTAQATREFEELIARLDFDIQAARTANANDGTLANLVDQKSAATLAYKEAQEQAYKDALDSLDPSRVAIRAENAVSQTEFGAGGKIAEALSTEKIAAPQVMPSLPKAPLTARELKGVRLAEQRIAEGRAEEALASIKGRLQDSANLTSEQFEILQAGLKRLNQHMEANALADDVLAAAPQPAAAKGGMVRSSANIWDDHAAGQYAVIPTNTVVKSNGEAVMGAGLAKQARDRFKGLAARYGAHLREAQANGTSAMLVDHENRLILVPTKGDWKLPSSVEQVDAALTELSTLDLPMSVPNLGAGNGQVPLKDIEALMSKHGVQPAAAAQVGTKGTLEVSTASKVPLGKDLSAFNLKITLPDGSVTSVESAYQAAKVWDRGGPHPEWANLPPAQAKRAANNLMRTWPHPLGRFRGFEYNGVSWPADNTSAFYDSLYREGLDSYFAQHPEALDELAQYNGFTDSRAAKGAIANQARTLQQYVDDLRSLAAEQPAAQAPSGVGVVSGGGTAKGPMNISLFGDEFDEFGRMLDPAVAAQRRQEEWLASGGSSMGVRGAVGGSEGGQDALNAAAAASEPEAALEDTARVLSGEADDELIASMDEVAADPSVPSSKRRIVKRGLEWIKNKKTRVAKARVAAGGEPAAEAAIAIQSQAENGGIYRFMRYPTSDPTETFKRLNNLDSLDELAMMADEGLNNMAWLQKSQGYVTDRETAAILNQIKTVNTPDGMRNFLKYYDKAMSFIKAWQLTTPGFHVRNTMGGIFNNYLAGVEIGSTSQFLRKLKQFKAGKLTGVEQEWMNAIYETVGSGQYSHHEIGVASSVTSNWNPLSPRYKLLAKSARFGGDVEFRLRGTLMWDRLSKGTSLQEALDDVTRYHFDYSNLSNFETGVVKRIVPFYVWTRYNFPLQIEMMAQSPSKYRFYQQFKHSMEGREDKGKPVPEFLRNEMFGIPLPTHIGGGQNFLTLDLPFTRTMAGATPDVENWDPKKLGTYPTLMDPYFSQMAVPIKAPIELALSRQFFKGIPLRDTSMSEGYLAGRTPIAESLGGKTKTDYIVEQALPMYGQLRRLIPTEKKHRDRLATNWASYVGLPLRTNTELDQANELARRRYLGR